MTKTTKRWIGVVLILAAIFCCASFVFDRYTLGQVYARTPAAEASLLPTYETYAKDYPRTDEEFQIGQYTLRGHVYGPGNTRGLIVFRHGITSQHQDYLALITAMVDKGWRVFAYDAIGCGESDGESVLGMSQSPLDVKAAVDYARENGLSDGMPLMLWGHSWGGYGVAAALATCPDVTACVSMSGYDSPVGILTATAAKSYGPVGMLQRPFLWLNTSIDFGQDADVSASGAVASSGVPTLAIHGTGDAVVPYETESILSALRARGLGEEGGAVQLESKTEEGRNGHNDYFYSPESQAYLNKCAKELEDVLESSGGDAGAPAVLEFLESVDMRAANTADPALIDQIDAFFGAHVAPAFPPRSVK